MASSSAAERSQADQELRHRRGEQVVLVFSGQVGPTCVLLVQHMLRSIRAQTACDELQDAANTVVVCMVQRPCA
jgi:hypothetical protein